MVGTLHDEEDGEDDGEDEEDDVVVMDQPGGLFRRSTASTSAPGPRDTWSDVDTMLSSVTNTPPASSATGAGVRMSLVPQPVSYLSKGIVFFLLFFNTLSD